MGKAIVISLMLSVVLFVGLASAGSDGMVRVQNLRCESLVDPLGIDVGKPRLSWYSESQQRAQKQTAYQVVVASSLEKLDADEGDLWQSGKIYSDQSINVVYGGRSLTSGMQCFWKVKVWDGKDGSSAWSETASWSMGLLSGAEWNATWIGLDRAVRSDKPDTQFRQLSARMVRKEFEATKGLRRATAYVCGLGLFELRINGKKVGRQVLVPALSEYPKRSFYLTFDVTKELLNGKNAVGVILGNGRFFASRQAFAPNQNIRIETNTYGYPKMILRMDIEYSDSTRQSLVSDTTWRISADGPITANSEFDGEDYDARKEMAGWDKAGFDDSGWMNAAKVSDPSEKLTAQPIAPIRVMEIIKPKSVKRIKPGVHIFDMGQNMVGWVSLRVRATRGTKVTMRFAETLKPDGSLYTDNLRAARQTDTYVAAGGGVEQWEPRFTYHGFRYVELTGYPGKPHVNTIEGKVVCDDMRTKGKFSCSNDIINKVYKAACWTMRGNYRSIPTDCPQRDERQAWLGDRSINSYGESFIFDNDKFYEKWMTDIADAQSDSGSIPDIAPAYWTVSTDNMTWPSSLLIISNNLYRQFGNIKVIADNYDAMKKWLFYMRDKYMKNYLLPQDKYGDWCIPPRTPTTTIWSQDPAMMTPLEYIGSTYFYHCLKLMEQHANLLRKEEDAREYASLADKVRDAINNTYLNKDSLYYANNAVTANALALSFGIPPKQTASKVFENLSFRMIRDHRGHTSTGLVGGQWIMRTLTDNGRIDLAYKLAINRDYPSWGYMVEQGGSTIWELWNGATADPLMNSHNHVMLLGDLVVWYYEDLAGIKSDPANPGFKHIIMKPCPVGNLRFVKASYESVYGSIRSEWHLQGARFGWDVSVPANTTATIYVPAVKESDVTESGKRASQADGVTFVKLEDGRAVYKVGSGRYHFVSQGNGVRH